MYAPWYQYFLQSQNGDIAPLLCCVGFRVGAGVGEAVGRRDGATLGCELGMSDGDAEGSDVDGGLLGNNDGEADSCGVLGAADTLGCIDGDTLGIVDGLADG